MKQTTLAIILLFVLIGFYPLVLSAHGPATSPTQLTFNTVTDADPVVSADGLRVAFTEEISGNFQVFIANSDGSGLLQLTSNRANHTSLSISGNGGKVAFQSDTGNDRDVWVINSDGSGSVALASGPADEMDPAISGDGMWVAFVSFASSYPNCPTCSNPQGDSEIFEIKTDGTSLQQVTSNTKYEFSPSVSSNGSKIAFQSNIPGTYEIFVINSDGTGLTQISYNSGDYTSSSPSISADGSKVAYDSNGPATMFAYNVMTIRPELLTTYEVYVANTNGGSPPVQVSATGGDNFTPSLSGDGSKVAYVSTGDGDREIYLANSDGSGAPTRTTDNTAYDAEPSADSDGDTVAFSSNIDGDFEIFVSHITSPIHDVAVIAVMIPRRIGYNAIMANPLKVNVTIMNQGTASETVSVEVYFLNGPTLSSQTTSIPPGASKTLTFGVVTQSLAMGSYTLLARAVPVPGEVDTSDNTMQGGVIQVRIPGDVDGDRDVDIVDAATLAFYYGGTCATPSGYVDPADLDNDCDIDIVDAATLAFYYGTST